MESGRLVSPQLLDFATTSTPAFGGMETIVPRGFSCPDQFLCSVIANLLLPALTTLELHR